MEKYASIIPIALKNDFRGEIPEINQRRVSILVNYQLQSPTFSVISDGSECSRMNIQNRPKCLKMTKQNRPKCLKMKKENRPNVIKLRFYIAKTSCLNFI